MSNIKTFAVESLAADIVSGRSGLVEDDSDVRDILRAFRAGAVSAETAWQRLGTLDGEVVAL